MMRDCEATIGKLIDKQGVAFISSVDADGFPNTKAMLPSMRVAQYRENPNACIYFCDKRYFRGVMLLGTVEVLEDAQSKEMIWKEGDTMYYAKGVTDPDYCVLKITVTKGRYYSNFSSETFAIPTPKDLPL